MQHSLLTKASNKLNMDPTVDIKQKEKKKNTFVLFAFILKKSFYFSTKFATTGRSDRVSSSKNLFSRQCQAWILSLRTEFILDILLAIYSRGKYSIKAPHFTFWIWFSPVKSFIFFFYIFSQMQNKKISGIIKKKYIYHKFPCIRRPLYKARWKKNIATFHEFILYL